MAIEVEIVGNGTYAGAKSNITEYQVTEDSTPVEASDTSGGTGQITFGAIDDPSRFGSALLLNDTVKLADGERGDTEGRINSITGNDGVLSITADSRLGRLVIETTAQPFAGTFSDAMMYYLSLGGITTNIAIDTSLAAIPVVAQGWKGDLWTKVKELAVINGAEITLIKGNVIIRPVRENRALEINNVSESWSAQNVDLAKNVEIFYYNSEHRTDSLVYPKGGWNEDVNIYTVDAGQTLEVNIPVDVSLTSIVQPVPQAFVARDEITSSVYSVAGNDGLPIPVAQWTAEGGSLSVAIGEDGHSIDLKVIGPNGASSRYAPFRIAVSSGPSDYYSSLRIIGTGVHFDQKSITVPTGVDDASTSRDVGVSVDNIFINSEADAWNAALNVTSKWASPTRTLTIGKSHINQPSETGQDYDYATFEEFDAYAATEGLTTFALFDAEWAGQTFAEFDEYWYNLVADQFRFQVFGNANGARVRFRRSMYRIRSVTITPLGVDYTAEEDTTFGDFDEYASAGMTFGSFDTSYDGLSFNDFALIPLPTAKPEDERGY
jgi:hypothetical protein